MNNVRSPKHPSLDGKVPSTWDELDQHQFRAICIARQARVPAARKVLITMVLLGISFRKPRRWWTWYVGLNKVERYCLVEKLSEGFIDLESMQSSPMQRLRIRRRGVLGWLRRHELLHLCHHDLMNKVESDIWGLVDGYFLQFHRDHRLDWLRCMVALLYGPRGMTREQRKENGSVKLANRVNVGDLFAVAMMWEAQRMTLERLCPRAFGSGTQKSGRKLRNWLEVMVAYSGQKFGAFHHTMAAPAVLFLREMHHILEQAARDRDKAQRR